MEKGKLNIRRKDNKKVILNLTKDNGKPLSISDRSLREADNWKGFADGDHEVSYELEGGLLVSITIGDKTIKRQQVQAPPQTQQANRNYHQNPPALGNHINIDSATAPYNFVPMNEQVLSVNEDDIPAFNTYKGYDGFIDLDITAKSPIYIRRNLSPAELEREEQVGTDMKDPKVQNFKDSLSGFNRPLGNEYRIPGSSLRGMIRTLYEVVTYSKMTMLDDHKLYYRSFADSSTELRDQYSSKMNGTVDGAYKPKASAGYLRKNGNKYQILEAASYHRVEESMVLGKGLITCKMRTGDQGHYRINKEYVDFIKKTPFIEVNYIADPEKPYPHSVDMYYSKVTDITSATNPIPAGYSRGFLVFSGWIPGPQARLGKHMHWVVSETTGTSYSVPENLIRDFDKDYNREGPDLLKLARKGDVPCFYVLEGGQVKAFGHTGLFRMVYNNSIGDLRPPEHKKTEMDMTEAVFGRIVDKKARMGRLYFEDAICTDPKETPVSRYPKILSGPKASSFQLYLHQDKSKISIKGKNTTGIKNYDSQGARLAGYKFYWHRDHRSWFADPAEVEKHRSQYTKIHPLDTGSKFRGRIRFVNLSKEELGALLFVLNLPEGCCHKLGMAKPLGLGSVRINAKLSLIDREERYTNLIASGIEAGQAEEFIKAYSDNLKAFLNTGENDVWNIDRLRELKRMLDKDNMPSHDRTRYMSITEGKFRGYHYPNEYKMRPILKKPTQTR